MLVFLAVLVLMLAPFLQFPRAIHSTTSMQKLAFPAVLAQRFALYLLSLKADKQ